MPDKKVFGIDLGTTFSCIAYVDEYGRPIVIKDYEMNESTLPSVVLIESPENMVVGKTAKESVDQVDRIVAFVKRSMGDANARWVFDDVTYTPEVISSQILRRLKDSAKAALSISDDDVKDVVITCPAYFGDLERKATKAAGVMAGFNVLNIISEPTAAAIFYGSKQTDQQEAGKSEGEKNILVYDLGGGTFDVTFLSVDLSSNPGKIEEVCTKGDHMLGGKDWDEAMYAYLLGEFTIRNPDIIIEGDEQAEYDLLLNAEKTKRQLSSKTAAKCILNRDNVEVTREKFEILTKDLLDRTISMTHDVLELAKGKGHPKVDEIILVGGSTKMPQVPEKLESEFGITPKIFDPDEAVAKGAAILANDLERRINITGLFEAEGINPDQINTSTPIEEQPLEIREVIEKNPELKSQFLLGSKNPLSGVVLKRITSKSFGIKAQINAEKDLAIVNMIIAQTSVPQKKVSDGFGLSEDGQTEIQMEVYENEIGEDTVDLKFGRLLGEATITDLPEGLKAGTLIQVTFDMSEDGMLFIKGECEGKWKDAKIETASVMTEEEIKEWKEKNKGIKITG